jgi:hypothetical protein
VAEISKEERHSWRNISLNTQNASRLGFERYDLMKPIRIHPLATHAHTNQQHRQWEFGTHPTYPPWSGQRQEH